MAPAPRARKTVDTLRAVVPHLYASLSRVEPMAVSTMPHIAMANLKGAQSRMCTDVRILRATPIESRAEQTTHGIIDV